MKFSQVQDVEYLFNYCLKHSKKLLVKFNNELITADFFNIADTHFKKIKEKFENEIRTKESNFDTPRWVNNDLISLKNIIEFVLSNDIPLTDNVMYNVEFINLKTRYDFYLVNENDTFDIVSLVD